MTQLKLPFKSKKNPDRIGLWCTVEGELIKSQDRLGRTLNHLKKTKKLLVEAGGATVIVAHLDMDIRLCAQAITDVRKCMRRACVNKENSKSVLS